MDLVILFFFKSEYLIPIFMLIMDLVLFFLEDIATSNQRTTTTNIHIHSCTPPQRYRASMGSSLIHRCPDLAYGLTLDLEPNHNI